jgi:hypothetical protein
MPYGVSVACFSLASGADAALSPNLVKGWTTQAASRLYMARADPRDRAAGKVTGWVSYSQTILKEYGEIAWARVA